MTRGSRIRHFIPMFCGALIVVGSLPPRASGAQHAPGIPRVRSENPLIAQLIVDALAASATFRGLVDAVNGTNGIVYVESGQCRQGTRACLMHSIDAAGPHRILRVLVNTRRDRNGLIGAIGHDLQHSLEVLVESVVTSTQGLFLHSHGT